MDAYVRGLDDYNMSDSGAWPEAATTEGSITRLRSGVDSIREQKTRRPPPARRQTAGSAQPMKQARNKVFHNLVGTLRQVVS